MDKYFNVFGWQEKSYQIMAQHPIVHTDYLRQGGNVFAGFCLFVWVHAITGKVMDGSFWNFEGMSGMAQTTSDSILGMIRQKSWILDHFEIFITIALKGTQGNRRQSEDSDATWRIALPWRRYLRAVTAF